MKELTVSIASYNVENCLKKCLDSLIRCKTIDALDIIIVDDGSTDKTKEIASKYAIDYPRSVRLISKKNGGHGSTINTSIQNCKGKYFKVLDADDWVESDNLDKLVEYLSNSEVDLILNPYYEVNVSSNEKKKKTVLRNSNLQEIENADFELIAKNIVLAMHSFTIKSSIIKKMGPIIDENCFYVDTEYTVFPIPYIMTVSVFQYPIYDYLLGTSTQSMNMKNMQRRREQHLRVVKRLVVFYETQKNVVSKGKKALIQGRTVGAINMQYVIYLGIEPNDIKKELVLFDSWLAKESPDLYFDAIERGKSNSGYIRLIGLMRKVGYKPYVGIVKVLRIFRIIK